MSQPIVPQTIGGLLSYVRTHVATWNTVVSSGGGDANGLDAAQVAALQTALTNATNDRNAAIAARSASLSATAKQNNSLDTLHDLVTQAIADIKAYANQQADPIAVYAEMEVPKPAPTGTRYSPVPVTEPVANPDANGNVELSWNGGANVAGTMYFIEGSADGSTWVQVYATKKRKVSLSGYTPGQAYWFRVKAANNDQVSVASNSVAIWGPGGSLTLSVAA